MDDDTSRFCLGSRPRLYHFGYTNEQITDVSSAQRILMSDELGPATGDLGI